MTTQTTSVLQTVGVLVARFMTWWRWLDTCYSMETRQDTQTPQRPPRPNGTSQKAPSCSAVTYWKPGRRSDLPVSSMPTHTRKPAPWSLLAKGNNGRQQRDPFGILCIFESSINHVTVPWCTLCFPVCSTSTTSLYLAPVYIYQENWPRNAGFHSHFSVLSLEHTLNRSRVHEVLLH